MKVLRVIPALLAAGWITVIGVQPVLAQVVAKPARPEQAQPKRPDRPDHRRPERERPARPERRDHDRPRPDRPRVEPVRPVSTAKR